MDNQDKTYQPFKFELSEAEIAEGLTEEQAKKRRDSAADCFGVIVGPPLLPGEEILGIATGEKYNP
jgi:hypothetical protein